MRRLRRLMPRVAQAAGGLGLAVAVLALSAGDWVAAGLGAVAVACAALTTVLDRSRKEQQR